MKAEVSIQLLKFCFQVLNCTLLVSGTLSGDDDGTEREADDDLSPVPVSVSVLLQVLGVSVLSCSLWILFSSENLLNVLPSGKLLLG